MNTEHRITALAVCTTQSNMQNLRVMIPTLGYVDIATKVYFFVYDVQSALYQLGRDCRTNTRFLPNTASNFGDAYNAAVARVIDDGHTTFAIANDDIVFDPDTWAKLQNDWADMSQERPQMGAMATRTNHVRPTPQNIRFSNGEPLEGMQYGLENSIAKVDVFSPILAVYKSDAWVDFEPINWFSDDVQCIDMAKNGFEFYVSTAYVHHVGSRTMRPETWENEYDKSVKYLAYHRPDVCKHFGIAASAEYKP